MKRPILKRTVKTIEVVTWTFEYEDVAESSPPPTSSPPQPPQEPSLSPEILASPPTTTSHLEKHASSKTQP